MTSASSWASAAPGWTSSTTSDPCVEARRRRLASGLVVPPGFLRLRRWCSCWLRHRCSCGCAAGVLAGCVAGVLAGCAPVFRAPSGPPAVRAAGVLAAVSPVFRWLGPRCSGRRRARPPSTPRASLGASARSLGRLVSPQSSRALISERPTNVACNSPATISNHELAALELQRFQTLLILYPVELHATFGVDLAAHRHHPYWWRVVAGARSARYHAPARQSFGASLAACLRAIWIGCAHVDRLCTSG